MRQAIERHAQSDAESPFLSAGVGGKVKTVLADYMGFVNLLLFFVLIWPIAMLCFGVDRVLKTRLLDGVIRFCEMF